MNHDRDRVLPIAGGGESFEEVCAQAVAVAASDLGLDARAFVEELAQGEIGLLISYLRASVPYIPDSALRADVEALLHRLTAWTGTR